MVRWIAGTLELSSKVRYGLTSRGVPLFRFIPYSKHIGPFAVGCQTKNIFYNVHAVVEPVESTDINSKSLPRANLIQMFGPITSESEKQVLLYTYAYNNTKELRKFEPAELPSPNLSLYSELAPESYTFHIDPPNCKDVDDAITLLKLSDTSYRVWIHIADVSAWIPEGSTPDMDAYLRSTSFYTPDGFPISPMLHTVLSEKKASLYPDSDKKPALSLSFTWVRGEGIFDLSWHLCLIQCANSFTYEDALDEFDELGDICSCLGANPSDPHTWIQSLMILYNSHAGKLLKEKSCGILRKQNGSVHEKVSQLMPFVNEYPELEVLCYESAYYCLATNSDTLHMSLKTNSYAYASSPLRRYVDLINQRLLKSILFGIPTNTSVSESMIMYLNQREKQAKAFQRDLFFGTSIATHCDSSVKGIVISPLNPHSKYRVYVPSWKRIIKVCCLNEPPLVGSHVSITWYHDPSQANWKEKIIFSAAITPSS
jgi:hypothetical protein